MHHLCPCSRRHPSLSRGFAACQALVRFFALHRIKPHAPPLVRAPVNSFEFHSYERLLGYLIPFAPLAFVSQCQCRPSRVLSPLVFFPISTYFTAPPEIPSTPTVLQLGSFHRLSRVEPWDLTANLKSHLQTLYAQSFRITLASSVLPWRLAQTKVLQEGGLTEVACHQLDILDTSSINQFADWLKENYGGLDILLIFSTSWETEIELLSRVHHKNLVGLVGFCFEKGEQMLVYEHIPNGTLMDSLSRKSGIWMDWIMRLKVALGAARGLTYLHELADPPIITY
ncbi:putative leucine-rich repeat receptor-like protein kinase [Glycine soja]|uniref:Putative leucine-rich repeat receptor-like protein kinase n=1 Tax=Glycine soja TaxID=3848 RepID=A0A445HP50_GLYSO|nr:putative leucine-rich repeat receptor-like protein kinase [Glycine soja]